MLRYSKRGTRGSPQDIIEDESDVGQGRVRQKKSRHVKIELEREESDLTKRRHEQIVKNLLEEFDIEDTKDKYRYGGDCSRSVSKERCNVGKTNKGCSSGLDVKTSKDRTWNETYKAMSFQHYEAKCIKKEQQLAQAEVDRIRKLKLEGIIPEDKEVEDNDILSQWSVDPNTNQWQQNIEKSKVPNNKKIYGIRSKPVKTAVQMDSRQKHAFRDIEDSSPDKPVPAVLIGDMPVSAKLKENLTTLYKEESLSGLYSAANKLVYTSHRGDAVEAQIPVA